MCANQINYSCLATIGGKTVDLCATIKNDSEEPTDSVSSPVDESVLAEESGLVKNPYTGEYKPIVTGDETGETTEPLVYDPIDGTWTPYDPAAETGPVITYNPLTGDYETVDPATETTTPLEYNPATGEFTVSDPTDIG